MSKYKTKEELLNEFDELTKKMVEGSDLTADSGRVKLEVLIDIRNLLDKENIFKREQI